MAFTHRLGKGMEDSEMFGFFWPISYSFSSLFSLRGLLSPNVVSVALFLVRPRFLLVHWVRSVDGFFAVCRHLIYVSSLSRLSAVVAC